MNHLMIDLINTSEKQSSPLCAIEAVFLSRQLVRLGRSFTHQSTSVKRKA